MSADDNAAEIAVIDNPAAGRYEILVDGEVAGEVVYEADHDRRTFVHTDIAPAFEGHGLGGRLAAGALADARARKLTVVPLCPFISGYLRRHHELLDVVEEPYRTELASTSGD
jgi:uncharacterized protein